jgi:hypothetical protein
LGVASDVLTKLAGLACEVKLPAVPVGSFQPLSVDLHGIRKKSLRIKAEFSQPEVSGLAALRQVRIPRVSGFRLHVGETRARRGIGNADEVLASGALNLPAGVARVALQGLVTVRAIELEFGGVHRLQLDHAQTER